MRVLSMSRDNLKCYLWYHGADGYQVTSFDPRTKPELGVESVKVYINEPAYDMAIEALKIISKQGWWSTKMKPKQYSKILDEYKELIDKTLKELGEVI